MASEMVERKFIRVRERNQITLPAAILAGLPIHTGDFLEVCRTADGVIHIKPTVVVTVDSSEALRQEQLADQDIDQKKYGTFTSASNLVSHLQERRKKKDKAKAAVAKEVVTA